MPRKRRSYILDERTIEAIAQLARQNHTSANRYLEGLLFNHAKSAGVLPMSAEPLPELRGGDQRAKAKEGAVND